MVRESVLRFFVIGLVLVRNNTLSGSNTFSGNVNSKLTNIALNHNNNNDEILSFLSLFLFLFF